MSYAEVFRIKPDGDVESFAEIRNGSAGAPVIWAHLAKKAGLREYGDERRLFALAATGVFTREEDIALSFTCDSAYVRRANIPQVVAALRSIWDKVNVSSPEGYRLEPTIRGLSDALEELFREPESEVRGACFRMTSVAENPWRLDDVETDIEDILNSTEEAIAQGKIDVSDVYSPGKAKESLLALVARIREKLDADPYRSFNFDHDTINAYHGEVFEIVDTVDSERAHLNEKVSKF